MVHTHCMNRLLIICGPTATGKTAIAVKLAKKFHGELVSADSRQVYRDMDIIDWRPFIKAAIERNPVSFGDLNEKNNYEVYSLLKELPQESIYDGNRLALPDEVWNFRRGDGIEKAFLLAGFLLHKDKTTSVTIEIANMNVILSTEGHEFHFTSGKNLKKSVHIKGSDFIIV